MDSSVGSSTLAGSRGSCREDHLDDHALLTMQLVPAPRGTLQLTEAPRGSPGGRHGIYSLDCFLHPEVANRATMSALTACTPKSGPQAGCGQWQHVFVDQIAVPASKTTPASPTAGYMTRFPSFCSCRYAPACPLVPDAQQA